MPGTICLGRADHHALTARLSGHLDSMILIPGKRAARGRALPALTDRKSGHRRDSVF